MADEGKDTITKPSSAKPLLAAGAYVERAFVKLEQDKQQHAPKKLSAINPHGRSEPNLMH
jgi:hypothetical protein